MWWQAVFWILLIPLVILEVILFLKTKKYSWLLYAVSIFTYVVAVSYTLDVFSMGKNAIILVLLASAALMTLVGKQLGKTVKKKKKYTKRNVWLAAVTFGIIALIFIVSVIFGQLDESVSPVQSITHDDLVVNTIDKEPRVVNREGPVILTRTLTNEFFLPVPVPQKLYRICFDTSDGKRDGWAVERYDTRPEVPPFDSLVFDVRIQQVYDEDTVTYEQLLVYEEPARQRSWESCSDISRQPDYTIQIV